MCEAQESAPVGAFLDVTHELDVPPPNDAPKPCVATPRQARAASTQPTGAKIWQLHGTLAHDDIRLVENNLWALSDRQMHSLAGHTDVAQFSMRFERAWRTLQRIDALYRQLGSTRTLSTALECLPEWLERRALSMAMAARVQAILLVGHTQERIINLSDTRCYGPPSEASGAAMAATVRAIAALPEHERERQARALAYELAQLDRALLLKWLDCVGLRLLRRCIPSLKANNTRAATLELLDPGPVSPYLRMQRACAAPPSARLRPSTDAILRNAAGTLLIADRYAKRHQKTLALHPAQSAEAQLLYTKAARRFRRALRAESAAIQDPRVRDWLARRSRALLLQHSAQAVIAAPRTPLGQWLARHMPAGSSPAARELLAVPSLEPHLAVGSPDPLAAACVPPEEATLRATHVVLVADAVNAGLRQALRQLRAVSAADATLCDSSMDIAATLQNIVAQDPDAQIVLAGYSTGVCAALAALDTLHCGSPQDRAAADQVVAFVSYYGLANGTPAAAACATVPEALAPQHWWHRLARARRVVSTDAFRRSRRHSFWQQAVLPNNIPYFSFVAHADGTSLPGVLAQTSPLITQAAGRLGLPPANDGLTLHCDAVVGNRDTPAGRAVRNCGLTLDVRGSHANLLMNGTTTAAPPVLAQLLAPLQALAEAGCLRTRRDHRDG